MRIEGADVLVIGMARSGRAAVELLGEHGARVRAMDEKPPAQPLDVPFVLQSAEAVGSPDLIVISPGVPADLPMLEEARGRGVPVIGEVELAGWYLAGQTIGITGSNGKTTTTALIGHILETCGVPRQVGGNIGRAPAAMVATSRAGQWNVLELSSFQLETVFRFHADIGVALNVTPDHLDRHHSFAEYAEAKARLFETQRAGDHAVLNADDPECVAYASKTRGQAHWFSSTHPVAPGLWLDRERILMDGEELLRRDEIPLRGIHNVENVMAAAAAAHLAGAEVAGIRAAIRTFPGVEHRLEFVRENRGVCYYNDSKATNVEATLNAIDAFSGGLWIILGGKDKNSDYHPLREPLEKKGRAALLIGAAAPKIAEQISGTVRLVHAKTMENAVGIAARDAGPGDVVLLAPACASFDQFQNFEHRGRVFKDLVRRLS